MCQSSDIFQNILQIWRHTDDDVDDVDDDDDYVDDVDDDDDDDDDDGVSKQSVCQSEIFQNFYNSGVMR